MSRDSSSAQGVELIARRVVAGVRGFFDVGQYDYIIVLFFLKFLSDLVSDRRAKGGLDKWMPLWSKLVVPPSCRWDFLKASSSLSDFSSRLNRALKLIEEKNPEALCGLAELVRLETLSDEQARSLFSAFEKISDADLRPSRLEAQGELGIFFDGLISQILDAQGGVGAGSFTPHSLGDIFARILQPQPGQVILDPFCGSGSLLSQVASYAGAVTCAAQHPSPRMVALCNLNLTIRGVENRFVKVSNALADPLQDGSGDLLKADVVVCNPPFGWRNWGGEELVLSRPELFVGGLKPQGGSEYAFLEHMLAVARGAAGRVGIIVSPGALSREAEKGSRRRLVEEELLFAVIGFPPKLFPHTAIPVVALLVDKAKRSGDLLFVDASRLGKANNVLSRLSDSDIQRIVQVVIDREEVHGFSRRVSREEVRAMDFRLSINSYVKDVSGGENHISPLELVNEIQEIESELTRVRSEINDFLSSYKSRFV